MPPVRYVTVNIKILQKQKLRLALLRLNLSKKGKKPRRDNVVDGNKLGGSRRS